MQASLTSGIEYDKKHVITAEMGTGHTGTAVLSTPSMIGLMEVTCLEAAGPHLDENESTVGIHVCVSHVAAAKEGEEVTVTTRLTDVTRRKLTFEVSARVGDRLLGEGTHKRAVIDMSKFG
ncbi:MAG: thioesterase family protein [Pseudonocardia sp.]|nr:thioesterase family protein [Pseudonocardia sp.]